MTEDLKMTGDDYNVALFTFFITYILFEVRSSIRIFDDSFHCKHNTSPIQARRHHPTSHEIAMSSHHR